MGEERDRERIRLQISFYGRVQGVGFRFTAQHAAEYYGLTGWVRNEYDGSVRAEVQGQRGAIEEWKQSLSRGRYIAIERLEEWEIPTIGEEHGFRTF